MLARVLIVQSPCPRGLRARPHSSKLTLSRFAECRCCSFVLCTFPRCHCFRFHFRENHAVGSTIFFSYALPVLSAAGQRERSETFSLGHFTSTSAQWGTSRRQTQRDRAMQFSHFSRAKSSLHPEKERFLSAKW